jgi:hypothetical protein
VVKETKGPLLGYAGDQSCGLSAVQSANTILVAHPPSQVRARLTLLEHSHRVASGYVEIRLSSRERMDPAAFGRRRLDLYNRTLAWLGGSLECNQYAASAELLSC